MLHSFSSIIDIDIQTASIRGAINPLANQVAIMSSYYNKKKGVKSKKVLTHARHINDICFELIKVAREVAKEHSDVEIELNKACNRTLSVYDVMRLKIDGEDKHGTAGSIIDIAKQLVNNVARILIVTDSADLLLIDKSIENVRKCLRDVENCDDICSFEDVFHKLKGVMEVLMKQISNRQMDLLDTQKKEELALVRSMWARCKERLKTSSSVAIVHPELESGTINRQLVIQEICDSLRKLQHVIKGRSHPDSQTKVGMLASCFEEFEVSVIFANKMESEQQHLLQNNLSIIMKEAISIADSASTREERQKTIHKLCQDSEVLLGLLIYSNSDINHEKHIEKICRTTEQLRHYLQLATLDHIVDFYFLPHIPFQVLYNVTAEGARNKDHHKESELQMTQHVLNLQMIAKMACSLSVETYHNKIVRITINNIVSLLKQVVYATRSLANQPKSEFIKQNMDVYRRGWTKELSLLVEAVDEITPVNEFIYISLSHCRENVEQIALILDAEMQCRDERTGGEFNWADLDQSVDALVNRTFRVLNVVKEERRKVVDERYLSNDPVMARIQFILKNTLKDTKQLCFEIVTSNTPKYEQLKLQAMNVVDQLSILQVDFSKASMRCDAYIESFNAELHSAEYELSKSLGNDRIQVTCHKICSILKVVVGTISEEGCSRKWQLVLQNLKDLTVETNNVDLYARELFSNSRTSGSKSEIYLSYSARIVDSARLALNESLRDMTLYVCYGDVFVAVLSSAKSIVSLLPEILKGCVSSSSKRKKVFKK